MLLPVLFAAVAVLVGVATERPDRWLVAFLVAALGLSAGMGLCAAATINELRWQLHPERRVGRIAVPPGLFVES